MEVIGTILGQGKIFSVPIDVTNFYTCPQGQQRIIFAALENISFKAVRACIIHRHRDGCVLQEYIKRKLI